MEKEQGEILQSSYDAEVWSPLCSEIIHVLQAGKAIVRQKLTFANFYEWSHVVR